MALHELIRSTIQLATPWISETEIDKGAKWRSEIHATLEAAQTGIIVLTPDNLRAPWLVFESGALSNKRDGVYTYLFGLTANQVGEPLDQFQGTASAKQDTLKMLKSVGRQIGAALDDAVLTKTFEHNWKEFEDALGAAKTLPIAAPPPPDVPAMLSEALAYLREQSRELASIKEALPSSEGFSTLTDYFGRQQPFYLPPPPGSPPPASAWGGSGLSGLRATETKKEIPQAGASLRGRYRKNRPEPPKS
jgi:hypothetical protein